MTASLLIPSPRPPPTLISSVLQSRAVRPGPQGKPLIIACGWPLDMKALGPVILPWAVLTRGNPVTARALLPGLDKRHVLNASEAGNHTRKCGGTSLEPERCREVACGSAGWEGHCYQGDSTCMTLCLFGSSCCPGTGKGLHWPCPNPRLPAVAPARAAAQDFHGL